MVSPRHFLAGAVAAGALLTCATPAFAATVSSDGTTISVTGGAEANTQPAGPARAYGLH